MAFLDIDPDVLFLEAGMGVHGLTSYLRDNKQTLSRTISLPQPNLPEPIPLIVDAWS